jgi:hypothetical protein
MTADYTLTVGMIDADGSLIAQADAQPPGYPTSAWLPGIAFADTRLLTVPAAAPPGEYRVYVGWYSTPDLVRLPARGEPVRDDLLVLPTPVRIAP